MVTFNQLIKKQGPAKVMIGLPVHSHIEAETAQSLVNLIMTTNQNVMVHFRTGTLIDRARSALAEAALEGGFDYLLFIDGDMIFPHDAFEKLLKHPYEIVSAFCTNRNFRHTIPVIGKFKYDGEQVTGVRTMLEYPKDKPFQVDSCGMAFTLISHNALQKIKALEPARGLFQQIPLPNGSVLPEDTSFCWRAKQAGISVWCDPNVSIGHKGPYIYTEQDYEAGFKEGLTKQFGELMP